jgi:CPA2 family monovalent cation:H+ antiporter-2
MQHIVLPFGILCLVILLLIFLLKQWQQPYLIAYILAGILLGPHLLAVFTNPQSIEDLGQLGVMLLMFFLGMEINIPDKKSDLAKPLIAQGVKTLLCFVFALACGHLLHWPMSSILLLTVLLTFNSTAVVSEFLKKNAELQSAHGRMVLNILLLQDILLAPVLTLFQVMGGGQPDLVKLASAVAGSFLIFLLLRAIRNRNLFQLPFIRALEADHDLQVFAAACICLGFGLLASVVGLTSAIGGFAAGLYIGRTKAFHWLEKVLQPFRVFFTALFFVSIGLLLDLSWLRSHYVLILSITLLVILINSLLSALVFRGLRYAWPESLYAGALLSQTGEFGLLACSLAYETGIIEEPLYKSGIAITALSLLLSTVWMAIVRRYVYKPIPGYR